MVPAKIGQESIKQNKMLPELEGDVPEGNNDPLKGL